MNIKKYLKETFKKKIITEALQLKNIFPVELADNIHVQEFLIHTVPLLTKDQKPLAYIRNLNDIGKTFITKKVGAQYSNYAEKIIIASFQ